MCIIKSTLFFLLFFKILVPLISVTEKNHSSQRCPGFRGGQSIAVSAWLWVGTFCPFVCPGTLTSPCLLQYETWSQLQNSPAALCSHFPIHNCFRDCRVQLVFLSPRRSIMTTQTPWNQGLLWAQHRLLPLKRQAVRCRLQILLHSNGSDG